MDLKAYYQKRRDVEAKLGDEDVVIVSLETPDGGKPGMKTEVKPRVAAKAVIDRRARLATDEERDQYRADAVLARERAEEIAAANRVTFAVIRDPEVKPKKSGSRGPRTGSTE